jgi:superfamily II DNA or RNA helicase
MQSIHLRGTVKVTDAGDAVRVDFPRALAREEEIALYNALSCDYYVQSKMLEYVKKRLKFIKQVGGSSYYIPFFALPVLESVCAGLGFRVAGTIRVGFSRISPGKANYRLYAFQKDAVDKWCANGYRGTVVIPTGGGKTFVALEAIRRLSVSTLVCVTTKELAEQWRGRLKEALGVDVGMLGDTKREIRPVTVAIYNSATKYVNLIKNRFGLLVCDECHHVPAQTFKTVAIAMKSPYRLALSATPKRYDANEALVFFTCGKIVYTANYQELVRLKLACPLKFYRIYVDLTSDEVMQYSSVDSANIFSFTKLAKIAYKAEKKYTVLRKLLEKLKDRKIIVFTQYVDQAEKAHKVAREVMKSAILTGSTKDRGEGLRPLQEREGELHSIRRPFSMRA